MQINKSKIVTLHTYRLCRYPPIISPFIYSVSISNERKDSELDKDRMNTLLVS